MRKRSSTGLVRAIWCRRSIRRVKSTLCSSIPASSTWAARSTSPSSACQELSSAWIVRMAPARSIETTGAKTRAFTIFESSIEFLMMFLRWLCSSRRIPMICRGAWPTIESTRWAYRRTISSPTTTTKCTLSSHQRRRDSRVRGMWTRWQASTRMPVPRMARREFSSRPTHQETRFKWMPLRWKTTTWRAMWRLAVYTLTLIRSCWPRGTSNRKFSTNWKRKDCQAP